MRLLVLGRGKTGELVAAVARERGHAVEVLGSAENVAGACLTAERLAGVDAVIDFTTPAAAVGNVRACLGHGARVVVGTTGWYRELDSLAGLARERDASLLYGTNFSIGVQAFFRAARVLARALPGYGFSIVETHHLAKKDAPSGTALTLRQVLLEELPEGAEVEIESRREGDVAGRHVLTATGGADRLVLEQEARSRRGFAEGAVRAAEWVVGQEPGVWDFADVSGRLE